MERKGGDDDNNNNEGDGDGKNAAASGSEGRRAAEEGNAGGAAAAHDEDARGDTTAASAADAVVVAAAAEDDDDDPPETSNDDDDETKDAPRQQNDKPESLPKGTSSSEDEGKAGADDDANNAKDEEDEDETMEDVSGSPDDTERNDDDAKGKQRRDGNDDEHSKDDDDEDEEENWFVLRRPKKQKKKRKREDSSNKADDGTNKKRKSTRITITIRSVGNDADKDAIRAKEEGTSGIDPNLDEVDVEDGYVVDDNGSADASSACSLSFYEETHEEQDPAFVLFQLDKELASLQRNLEETNRADASGRKEIDAHIAAQTEHKRQQMAASLSKYSQRAVYEQKRDQARLQQLYQQKKASNSKKIGEGIQILRDRHGKEMTALQQQQQHREPQQFQQLVQQLQSKQQRQMQEFTAKGEQVKRKTESDYRREMEKIAKHYQSRVRDIEGNRQKIQAKLQTGFSQIRQRYLKRHLQRVMKRKEACLKAIERIRLLKRKYEPKRDGSDDAAPHAVADATFAGPPPVDASVSMDASAGSQSQKAKTGQQQQHQEKEEFRQPDPIKSILHWAVEEMSSSQPGLPPLLAPTGAAARHKHRKTIMSQTARQLSIEIHNEGLWVSLTNESSGKCGSSTQGGGDDSSKSNNAGGGSQAAGDASKKPPGEASTTGDTSPASTTEDFIPWGCRAHTVLESLVAGEIPHGYEKFNFGEASSLQSGQVRCVLTDLRCSEESASSQRAASIRLLEQSAILDLEKKVKNLHSVFTEAEKAVAKAQEEEKIAAKTLENEQRSLAKAQHMQKEFTNKFRNYIGPGMWCLPFPFPMHWAHLDTI